jgi:hypothetical protein
MDPGVFIGDWPQNLIISTSDDGMVWEPLVIEVGAGGRMQFTFPSRSARHIKMAAEPFSLRRKWSIAEIALYGP